MGLFVANHVRSYFTTVIAIVAPVLRFLAALVPYVASQGPLQFVPSAALFASEGLVGSRRLALTTTTSGVYNQTQVRSM